MAIPKRLLRNLPTRSNRGADMPAIIVPNSFVTARMPRNPEKRKSWKDGAERAGRQFNAGPDAEARHAKRRAEIDSAAGERRSRRDMRRHFRFGAGIAACADMRDEDTIWGDNDGTVTQSADSAYA